MIEVLAKILGAVMGAALSFATRAYVSRFLEKLPLIPSTKWGYTMELRAFVAQMPFIYVDLALDVADTFVDIELTSSPFDPRTKSSVRRRRNSFSALRYSRKFILLGEAGIGKTTLFRFVTLSLLAKDDGRLRDFLVPAEKVPLPLYVPLKALDATSRLPILRYVQSTHVYFRGKWGLRRLTQLAKSHRLMLLLDGYDEIPIATGLSYIQEELELFFFHSVTRAERTLGKSEYATFYSSFVGNRVGMSSRREFYVAHEVSLPSGVSVIGSLGVWDSRTDLVRCIFDKYRLRGGEFYVERLNEELFMQQLLVYGENGLEHLSHNPLFLTVICYVYVNELRAKRDLTTFWRQGELELIDKCIDLLLIDLDSFKVRGLPEVHRRALMNRRSAFSEEKKDFLQCLAAEAVLDGQSVFSLTWINEAARAFFSKRSSTNSTVILQGLTSDNATANIVLQIIYSGLLVLVPTASQPVFDFRIVAFVMFSQQIT